MVDYEVHRLIEIDLVEHGIELIINVRLLIEIQHHEELLQLLPLD
jgi:hypothetical protein